MKWKKHFVKPKHITMDEAIQIASEQLNVPWNNRRVREAIIENQNGFSSHVYVLQLKNVQEWLEVSVDVESGEIIHVVDFSSKASYLALPVTSINPIEGGFSLIKDPENYEASPLGWNNDGKQIFNDSRGNNVLACAIDKHASEYTLLYAEKHPGTDLFASEWNPDEPPHSEANIEASIINLFYLVNFCHDLFYEYVRI